KEENQTLATITIQNYFRMYEKLAGMTGTAKTQLVEFEEVYKLGVVEIPTNQPMVRADRQAGLYKKEEAKWTAATDDRLRRHENGSGTRPSTSRSSRSSRPRRTPSTTRSWSAGACTSSERNATSPAGSTTSSGAGPAARGTPASRSSTCRSRTT